MAFYFTGSIELRIENRAQKNNALHCFKQCCYSTLK